MFLSPRFFYNDYETSSFLTFGLAEVSLKQTSECFSMSCLIASHFISHFASLVTSKPLYYKGFLIFYKKHRI